MEHHLSEGEALALSQMKNGSRLRTRQGSLTIQGLVDFMNPDTLVPPPLLLPPVIKLANTLHYSVPLLANTLHYSVPLLANTLNYSVTFLLANTLHDSAPLWLANALHYSVTLSQ